jgi:hypothetical protein
VGINALVLPSGANPQCGVRVASRYGACGPVVDRLRRVLAIHAVQAGKEGNTSLQFRRERKQRHELFTKTVSELSLVIEPERRSTQA